MLLSVRIVSRPPLSTPVGRNWEKHTVAWSCAATSAGRDTSYASGTGRRSTFGGTGPYGPAGGRGGSAASASGAGGGSIFGGTGPYGPAGGSAAPRNCPASLAGWRKQR